MRYIEQWCDEAVSFIRFPPDRPPVKQELMEHMQDKYDGYVAEGMKSNEAERRAIREMGDAWETGLLLRKIHKPYLGWFWRLTQLALIIVLITAVVCGVRWGKNQWYEEITYYTYDPFEDTSYEFENGDRRERVIYLEPDSSARCNGYTFTVTKVACWEGTSSTPLGGETETSSFYILLEVFNPRPWVDRTEAPYWLSAEDSLGNICTPYFEYWSSDERQNELYVWGDGYHTAPFTDTWELTLNNYVYEGADWIDLRYDRGGEEFTIRIDLTGGEGA